MATKAVTTKTFQKEVIEKSKKQPVLVDFWAEWCGPCRAVAPVLEAISEEHPNDIVIVKVNTDENPEISAQYMITSIPTLLVFENGEPVKQIVGARPKRTLLQDLKAFIPPK